MLDKDPRDRAALRLRAYTYLQEKKWKKAIADYDTAINTIAAVDVEGRTRRGFAYRNLKKYDRALIDFTKVIEAKPKDIEAYRRRAYLYRLMGQNDKAAADLEKILTLKPNDADAKSRLEYVQNKKPAQAKASPTPKGKADASPTPAAR